MMVENKNIKGKSLNKFNLIKIPKSYFTQEEWDEELFDDKVEKFLLNNYNIILDYYTFEIQDNGLKVFNINSRGSLMENIMQDNFDKKWKSKVGDLDNDVLTTSEFLNYLENGKSLLNESIEDNSNGYSVKTVFVTNQLEESFEIHDTLNPKIFNLETNKMHPEVKDALLKISNLFIDGMKENNVPLNIVDYHLLGSNAAYNYTPDSDLDVHIIVDIKSLRGIDDYNIIANLYTYAKSNFNNKYEFMVKGHPVEVYLEDVTSPAKSNGVYSLLEDEWVKVPDKQEPRIINIEETELYQQLENDYNNLTPYGAMDFLDKLYAIRQHSLNIDGEFGDGNLIFKEFRNRGYIDNIKDMIIKLREKSLSLQD